jgi:K+-transporting ATPase KdpF subunit
MVLVDSMLIVSAIVAVILLGYLLYALIRPERLG